jgi:dienelactone hydrolase
MLYVDHIFCILSGRAGGIAAGVVLLVTVSLVVLMSRLRLIRRRRVIAAIAVGGLALTAMLIAPCLLSASRLQGKRGPFEVQQATLVLSSLAENGLSAPIRMEIWFPASRLDGSMPISMTCAAFLSHPVANTGNAKRLLLYFPHFGSQRNDNMARLSYLASFGYVVVAFDDIAQDAPPLGATAEDEEARLRMWHVPTEEDFKKTLHLDDIRVRRQAEKALAGLDRLTACAGQQPGSSWSSAVDYGHVGFLGYSFGGSTAAEAAIMDSRIVAAVNLDGNLFGQALAGHLTVPYLYVTSDHPEVTLTAMMSNNPDERYGSRIDARDRREQARLAARDGSMGIRIKGAVHASLSDAVLEPHASRLWLLNNPIAFFNAINVYTRAFFDIHLAGKSATSVDGKPAKSAVVQTFKEIGLTPDREFVSPPP